MKPLLLTFCATSLLLAACNSNEKTANSEASKSDSSATASKEKMDDKKADNTYTMPDSATINKNWMAYASPGDAHKMLAKSNGTWNTEVTFKEMPDGPSQTTTGMTTNKMVMGGRYQVSTFTGKMMNMPFEGMSTVAYDNFKKVLISTWIDNMGTGIMKMEGPWDEASKSATMTGKVVDLTAGKELDCKEVFKIIDDNTQTLEMYKPAPDGKEFKCMEIKYTRKK